MNLCIDLCCGLKGFSQAFAESPDWEVVTVDINPKFEPTMVADVCNLTAKDIEMKTTLGSFSSYERVVVIASPPCNHFSTAGLVNGWPRRGIREAFEIFGACLEIVAEIKDEIGEKHGWIIENPVSIIGKMVGKRYRHRVRLSDYGSPFKKPTYLWTNLNLPLVIGIGEWVKAPRERYFNRFQRTGIMGVKTSEERSKMPYGLSKAILMSVESEAKLVVT